MNKKICTKCFIEKELTEYNKRSKSLDGLQLACNQCRNTQYKLYYQSKKDNIKYNNLQYYYENKKDILANKDKIKVSRYNKQYKESNKEKVQEYMKKYRVGNAEAIKLKKQQYKKSHRPEINAYGRQRMKTNPEAKLAKTIRRRTNEFIKLQGFSKKYKFQEYIGCTV